MQCNYIASDGQIQFCYGMLGETDYSKESKDWKALALLSFGVAIARHPAEGGVTGRFVIILRRKPTGLPVG